MSPATVTPGFGNEQFIPDFQVAANLTLNSNGSFDGDANNLWSYNAPMGENKKTCLVFTGLNEKGMAIWEKK